MKISKNKGSLLSRWKTKSNKQDGLASIAKAPENIDIPLSRGQQRLWFLQQLYPDNPFYNYCETYVLKGPINEAILEKSIQKVFTNNSIFRSTYHIDAGEIFQKTHDTSLPIVLIDLSKMEVKEKLIRSEEIIDTESSKAFRLSIFPLVNTSIIKFSENEHHIILNMHHIITDKWSMGIFRKELADTYKSYLNGNLPKAQKEFQYSDYAYWESSQKVDEQQLEYWKDKLSGKIPRLQLPIDFPRKTNPSFKGAFNSRALDKDLSQKVIELSKKLETTPYVLLLTTFYLLLFKYTKQEDIFIGSPISNRNEKILEKIIGFFNETVVLRTKLSNDMLFNELVDQVKYNTLEAFSNKDIPFDLLVKELKLNRSMSVNPFFQVMFLFHSVPDTPEFGNGIKLEHNVRDLGVSKFDLTLYVAEEQGRLSTTFEYATDLFHNFTINRFQEQFEVLLRCIVSDSNQTIGTLGKLTDAERLGLDQQVEIFDSPYEGIHELIEFQAIKKPNNIAVSYEDDSITYSELDKRSTQLALNLQKHTRGKNRFIGLSTERSIEMIVALLGILKAGSAYLPIDPDYPDQRMDFMLKDAGIDVLLTSESLVDRFASKCNFVSTISSLCTMPIEEGIVLPSPNLEHHAYLIYTSGSSGKPKGVAISHKNIISSTKSRSKLYKNDPSSFLLMSSISFDSSKAGIFWPLTTGGELIVSQKHLEQDINTLLEVITEKKVSHTLMLPTLYKLLLENSNGNMLPHLETVIVAGESCPSSLVKLHFSLFPRKEIYNEYGPTEATVWCMAHKISPKDGQGIVPIGKAVANASVYLLDDHREQVPYGTIGEIYIGGDGVSNGYLNRSDLSQKSFSDNPFDGYMTKLYRTGDLGRYRYDGTIEFLGRLDNQIKIRGYRIELPEIENSIMTTGMINEVIVNIEGRNSLDIDNTKDLSHTELISFVDQHLKEGEIDQLIKSVENIQPNERSYLIAQFDK